MEKIKVYVLRGLMGSGKTTWCKKFLTENQQLAINSSPKGRRFLAKFRLKIIKDKQNEIRN